MRTAIWYAKSCLCRANCPVVLSCVVCFCYRCYVLIGSTGVICVGEKQGAMEDQTHVEKEKEKKVEHNTYYTRYCSMFERKLTAQHDTASQRRARHRTARLRTALRCAAGLYIAGRIRAGRALWSNSVVVPDGMYKPAVVVPVCTISLKVFSLVPIPVSSGKQNDSHEKNIRISMWFCGVL